MKSTKPTGVDEYIEGFPKDTQLVLQQLRTTIKQAAPDAEEAISYAMPTFKLNGHYLVYLAGYKNQVSLYPAPRRNEAFEDELAVYKGGKGTVQFPFDKPLPLHLITRIVQFRIKENLEKAAKK